MAKTASLKNLVKILIGTAWLDGKVQPEERQYLHQIAQAKGVAADPEIQALLNEFRVVQPAECYQWVSAYLGDRPSPEDCQNLLEAISGLIYSDGDVATEEAEFLTDLQSFKGATQPVHHAAIRQIQKLYRRWVESQN